MDIAPYAAAIKVGLYLFLFVSMAVVAAVVRNMIQDAGLAKILKKGAKKSEKADDILAKPVEKGQGLLDRLRARLGRK